MRVMKLQMLWEALYVFQQVSAQRRLDRNGRLLEPGV